MNYGHVLLDAMNHAYRGWWPWRNSVTADCRDNSIERGFVQGLLTFLQRFPTSEIVPVWDGQPVQQLELAPDYKSGRAEKHANRPADWHTRCFRLRELLATLFPTLWDPHAEADQEIARFVHRAANDRHLIISTDADLQQLLGDHVDVFRPGMVPDLYTVDDFRREYEFEPEAFVLYRALTGDRSDNIRGLPYFPKAVACRLAGHYGEVDQLYAALREGRYSSMRPELTSTQTRKLLTGEDQIRSNVKLIDLLAETDPPHLTRPTMDLKPLRQLLHELDLGVLAGEPSNGNYDYEIPLFRKGQNRGRNAKK